MMAGALEWAEGDGDDPGGAAGDDGLSTVPYDVPVDPETYVDPTPQTPATPWTPIRRRGPRQRVRG